MDKSTSNQPDSKSRSVDALASSALAPVRKLPQGQPTSVLDHMCKVILALDVTGLGSVEGLGAVWLHTAINLDTGYSFGSVAVDVSIDTFQDLLRQRVLPHYHARGRAISTVITDRSNLWRDRDGCAFDAYLVSHGIEHTYDAFAKPLTWGKVERLLAQFARLYLNGTSNIAPKLVTLEELQSAYDLWAYHQSNRYIIE